MNHQRLLAAYHYCTHWHTGQGSREYRLLSKIILPRKSGGFGFLSTASFRPSRDEVLSCLATEENEEARGIYMALVTSRGKGDMSSGYIDCACCGMPMMCDCIAAEAGVTMCDACHEHECDPHEPCNIPDEDEEDDDDDE